MVCLRRTGSSPSATSARYGTSPKEKGFGLAHWYSGYIGGRFQSYAIGDILSAQFHAAALRAQPDIPREIANGKFGTLHTWLRDNLYRHGSKFVPRAISFYRKDGFVITGDTVNALSGRPVHHMSWQP